MPTRPIDVSRSRITGGKVVETRTERPADAEALAEDKAASFRRLADGQLDASYRLASAVLGDPTEAEDAVHDAFITAWRKWQTLRDRSKFEAWFRRILVNTCRTRLRGNTRRATISLPQDLVIPIEDGTTIVLERAVLDEAFAALKDDDKVVLVLRYFHDLKVEDVAAAMGVPRGTVASRLHRAQAQMRAALDASARKDTRS